jgi:hypothetical protein
MGGDRYPRQVFEAAWPKLRRGGEAKVWRKEAAGILAQCGIEEGKLADDINWDNLQATVADTVYASSDDCRSTGRKIDAYRELGDGVVLQPFLRGCLDLGCRLKFKFRSGSHGLGEEMGRRRGVDREDRLCELCGAAVETVAHFMLDCPTLGVLRTPFLISLRSLVGTEKLDAFQSLPSDIQARQLLAYSPWGGLAGDVDHLVREYISSAWKVRSVHLHGEQSHYFQEGISAPSSSPSSIPSPLISDSVWCRRVIHGLNGSDVSK